MKHIKHFINYLNEHQIIEQIDLKDWETQRAIYQGPGTYQYDKKNENESVNAGDFLIHSGTTLFLNNKIAIPPAWKNDLVGLEFRVGQTDIKTNHEGLVSLDGVPYHGIDRNRSVVFLPEPDSKKLTYEVTIELFNPAAQVLDRLNFQNEPAEHRPAPLFLLSSKIMRVNRAVESLLFTVKAYFEAALLLPADDLKRNRIIDVLKVAADRTLHLSTEEIVEQTEVKAIENHIIAQLKELKGTWDGKIHMVGQSHIDLAWLWPAKEAVRKCSRTFSTMSTLLDQFPHFGYAQSQPQAYEFIKHHYPEIYERVKAHIASGRWEVVGGMWVEPDLNIPSGESLVRQLIYGMTFYQEEFGVKPRIEWLPDTFGYCASLPQLLKKAGLEYFMTTKMNWNDTNSFPYDLFNWVGIDGTRIISFLNHGLNEPTHPKEIQEHWNSYKQKHQHPEQMLLYGHGDGGGGVTREMIHYVERSKQLPGLPESVFSTAHDFFDGIKEAQPDLPSWRGDMYLELHRGTYTTHAHNKRWNRKAEVLYRDAEIWASFAKWYDNSEQSTATLKEGWKLLLFNQFHDIIPGTSIPEVYTTSEAEYKEIFKIGNQEKERSLNVLVDEINTRGEGIPVVIFNSLSWDRSEVVTIKGGNELKDLIACDEDENVLMTDVIYSDESNIQVSVYVPNIPQMGYRTIWLKPHSQKVAEADPTFNGKWETDYYQVEWNAQGEISRLYDKQARREVLKPNDTVNQFQLFVDKPRMWDAWDIDADFADQLADQTTLLSVNVIQKGHTKDILRFKWSLSDSFIEQDIIFYHHSPRIDFETQVEWNEAHKLLKVSFPVDVLADKATFEIPFGTIDRATHDNTTWEQAQFEVCAHRFADLSEANYGVSLLNDCKYGYDVKNNVLRLSLLRAPKWPDPGADQGSHVFTYSLYPHEGDWREAQVTKKGYELNHPVTVMRTTNHDGALPHHHRFIQMNAKNVVLDTVKPAEEEGLTLRFYEATGGREQFEIKLGTEVHAATETNLLEEFVSDIAVKDQALLTDHLPYEVKTICLKV